MCLSNFVLCFILFWLMRVHKNTRRCLPFIIFQVAGFFHDPSDLYIMLYNTEPHMPCFRSAVVSGPSGIISQHFSHGIQHDLNYLHTMLWVEIYT